MKKSIWIMAAAMIGFICMDAPIPVHSQEDVTVVEDGVFKSRERPLAVFPHDNHNEKAGIDNCETCHHLYKNGNMLPGESSEGQECSECHELTGRDNTKPVMKAYHGLCNKCHREKKRGPVTCGECHSRGSLGKK